MLWLVFAIFSLICTYLGEVGGKYRLIFRFLLIALLSYLPSFGAQVAEDHHSYAMSYLHEHHTVEVSLLDINTKNEFGYTLINMIGRYLGLGVPGFFYLICFIINSLYVNVIYRFKYPVLAVFIFITSVVYFQEANLVRQSIAIAIFLYSLKYLIKGNFKKYIILIIIASTIHLSAIFLLALSAIKFVKKESYYYIYIAICGIWILSIFTSIFNIELLFIDNLLANIFDESIYSIYVETESDMGSKTTFSIVNIIYNLCVFMNIVNFNNNNKNNIYVWIYILGCTFFNFSISFPFLIRFAYYFSFIMPFYTPELLSYLKFDKAKFIISSIIIIIYLYYFYLLLFNHILGDPLLGKKLYPINDFFK